MRTLGLNGLTHSHQFGTLILQNPAGAIGYIVTPFSISRVYRGVYLQIGIPIEITLRMLVIAVDFTENELKGNS